MVQSKKSEECLSLGAVRVILLPSLRSFQGPRARVHGASVVDVVSFASLAGHQKKF